MKWYQAERAAGLKSRSRRPRLSPHQKVFKKQENWIIGFRKEQQLGARRIQSELIWRHRLKVSLAMIHKVLKRHRVKPLFRLRRKLHFKRYERPVPSERIQMDTMELKPGLNQKTTVDDCSYFMVVGLYSGLDEFYIMADFDDLELQIRLEEWQFHYNWMRGHGGLAGKGPIDRVTDRSSSLSGQAKIWYDPSKERLREADYSLDLRLAKLQGSL